MPRARKPLAPKKEREKKKAVDEKGNAERKRKAAFMPPEASVCERKTACVHFSLAFPDHELNMRLRHFLPWSAFLHLFPFFLYSGPG
jgi:hypothetical protein